MDWSGLSERDLRLKFYPAYLTTFVGVGEIFMGALGFLGILARGVSSFVRDTQEIATTPGEEANLELIPWFAGGLLVGVVALVAGWAMVRGLGRQEWRRFRWGAAGGVVSSAGWLAMNTLAPMGWIGDGEWAIGLPLVAGVMQLVALVASPRPG